jgi:hypothetical protein
MVLQAAAISRTSCGPTENALVSRIVAAIERRVHQAVRRRTAQRGQRVRQRAERVALKALAPAE